MRRIVVLGSNGYLARNLIYVLRRDYSDYELMLYGVEESSIDGFENYHCVDMTKRESVSDVDLSCDVVFMFVGRTGSANGFDEFDSFIDINERALLNLLDEYRIQHSKARVVFPSTRLVYKGKKGFQNEESEKEFKTVYAINKYACEQYLEQYHRVFDVEYTVLRICVPYGTLVPGASSYGTAEFMLSKASNGDSITIYGDGSLRRTLTHIEDLCVAVIKASLCEECANAVFNIGGEDFSLNEMAKHIADRFGVEIEYVPWPEVALKIESGDTVFDSSKLDGIIGEYKTNKFLDWVIGKSGEGN